MFGKKGMYRLHGKVGGNLAIRAVGRGHSYDKYRAQGCEFQECPVVGNVL